MTRHSYQSTAMCRALIQNGPQQRIIEHTEARHQIFSRFHVLTQHPFLYYPSIYVVYPKELSSLDVSQIKILYVFLITTSVQLILHLSHIKKSSEHLRF